MFSKKIFGGEKESNTQTHEGRLTELGEIDCCPYCKKHLETVPKRKKKCDSCGKYIYVRTRPIDRKKVLVTEEGKSEVDEQWATHYELQEEKELLKDPTYVTIKKELREKFGKEPPIHDVKWAKYTQESRQHLSAGELGLYRNARSNMAELLKKEGRFRQALEILFEVTYLDLCGAENDGKFNVDLAFLAPGIVSEIEDCISNLEITPEDARKIFSDVNAQRKLSKNLPVSIGAAWKKLVKAFDANKKMIEFNNEINELNIDDTDHMLNEIEIFVRKKDIQKANKLIYRLKKIYSSKKEPLPKPERFKKLLDELLSSDEPSVVWLGEFLLIFLIKTDIKRFGNEAENYVTYINKNFEKYGGSQIIGEIARINIDLIKPLVPTLLDALKNHPEWNTRRFVSFNIGAIGSKEPELVREAIPVMIDYIKNPQEVTHRKHSKITAGDFSIEMDLISDVDQTQWLKDAYIDSLGMIAKGDKNPILEHKALFEHIAKRDGSEYSRKKAQKVLDLLN